MYKGPVLSVLWDTTVYVTYIYVPPQGRTYEFILGGVLKRGGCREGVGPSLKGSGA